MQYGIGSKSNPNQQSASSDKETSATRQMLWALFVRYCAELGHGEIEKLKIQDGVPVMAELTTKKVRFGP